MPFLSLTSWSLHRNLGPLRMTRWDAETKRHVTEELPQPETLSLLDLPAAAAAKGFQALEICHFHFPSTEPDYLIRLRKAFQEAGILFYSLLIDYGDITSSDESRRSADIRFIESWIDVAAQAGAERVRIIAGNANPDDREAMSRSVEALNHLAGYAGSKGVRVVTENFHKFASTAENCLQLLKACEDRIGLTADYGNFALPGKYDALAAVLPRAESVHAKAHYDDNGFPDTDEFRRCLDLAREARYEGPFTLVYDGPGDQWAGIERIRKIAEDYL